MTQFYAKGGFQDGRAYLTDSDKDLVAFLSELQTHLLTKKNVGLNTLLSTACKSPFFSGRKGKNSGNIPIRSKSGCMQHWLILGWLS